MKIVTKRREMIDFVVKYDHKKVRRFGIYKLTIYYGKINPDRDRGNGRDGRHKRYVPNVYTMVYT